MKLHLYFSFCLVLPFGFVSYGWAEPQQCGTTEMTVSDKTLSFVWSIKLSGEDGFLNNSTFNVNTGNLTFEDLESQYWTFHIDKSHFWGTNNINLRINTYANTSADSMDAIVYDITPTIYIKDQSIALKSAVTPKYSRLKAPMSNMYAATQGMATVIQNWGPGLQKINFNIRKNFTFTTGKKQNRKRTTDPNPTPESSMPPPPPPPPSLPPPPPAFLPPLPQMMNPLATNLGNYRSASWFNVFPELNKTLSEVGEVKEFKIKYLIKVTTWKNDFKWGSCT